MVKEKETVEERLSVFIKTLELEIESCGKQMGMQKDCNNLIEAYELGIRIKEKKLDVECLIEILENK